MIKLIVKVLFLRQKQFSFISANEQMGKTLNSFSNINDIKTETPTNKY